MALGTKDDAAARPATPAMPSPRPPTAPAGFHVLAKPTGPDLQPRLRVLLLPVEGGAVPRRPVPHDRRPARHLHPPAARVAHRRPRSPSPGRAASPRSWASTSSAGRSSWPSSYRRPGQTRRSTPSRPTARCSPTSGASCWPSTTSWSASASTGRRELHDALPGRQEGQPDLRQGARAASTCSKQHGVDVQRAVHGQRREPGPPARGVPLLPRRPRRRASSSSSPSSSATTTPASRRATPSPTARSTPRPGAGS